MLHAVPDTESNADLRQAVLALRDLLAAYDHDPSNVEAVSARQQARLVLQKHRRIIEPKGGFA